MKVYLTSPQPKLLVSTFLLTLLLLICGVLFNDISVLSLGRLTTPTSLFPNNENESIRKRKLDNDSKEIVKSPSCLDPNGPTPIILLTRGRSGSGSTWQILGSLTGMEVPSDEYTGSDVKGSERFFEDLESKDDLEGAWLLKVLCEKQRQSPGAGVVGIKWKPFTSIFSKASVGTLKLIAHMAEEEQIKVIRSRRNPLDVMISKSKHSIGGKTVKAHCKPTDEECIKRHHESWNDLVLPTDELEENLRLWKKEEDEVDNMLSNFGVPHVKVSYEKLYHEDNAEEWMRIFKFLGKGPSEGLDIETVRGVMEHADTSSPTQRDALRNYDEVESLLKGTDFEGWLHR